MNYKKLYSGEHLKRINPNWTFEKWSYKHTFIAKMKYINNLLSKVPKGCRILDVGCGQGLLVKEFKRKGYDIVGIDKFYSNEYVIKEDIFDNSFEDNSFDLILCLDVIEHFNFDFQEKLIQELTRILKPKGKLIFSIPNLAHLSSRVMFLFTGNLLRTAKISYHPGDRPIKEYLKIIKKYLKIEKKKGISATIPGFFQLTQLFPQYTSWLYWLIKPFNVIWGWCFNVVIICKKKKK
jgi:2-polyprenyl-3-methyl-5-hydroxy-6-metoxy-1,4-benzoquinol methylase